jgi:acyl carrier protein
MNREKIKKVVIELIEKRLNVNNIKESSLLKDELGATSLNIVEIMLDCEVYMNVEIDDTDADLEIETAGDMINYTMSLKDN